MRTLAAPHGFLFGCKPHFFQLFQRIVRNGGSGGQARRLDAAHIQHPGRILCGTDNKILLTGYCPHAGKVADGLAQIYRGHALAAKSSYLIQTALGSSPVITIFYRLGIRTHNQISVHSGGYQNALTQNAGALKDYMVDQIAAGLIQQIVLSA